MKSVLTLVFLLLLCSVAAAQEYPKAELFGGYSYLRTDSEDIDLVAGNQVTTTRRHGGNLNGFNLSANYNPAKWLGIVIDFSGHYGSIDNTVIVPGTVNATFGVRTNLHTLLGGPQFAWRGDNTTFFVRALAGVGFQDQTLTLGGQKIADDRTAFAAAVGGGVDIKLTDTISLRAAQVEYLLTRFGDQNITINGQRLSASDTQHNLRISTGFVFRNRD
ncbi:MAG: outer membrane protein [Blastocatellales bacterium]